MFAGNFAIRGYAFCDGSLMSIAQNTALFSILGTTYGGDGRATFGLPDLRGRVPIHAAQGPGLSPYVLGELGGTETVTLTATELPAHSHAIACQTDGGNQTTPVNGFPASDQTGNAVPYADSANGVMNPAAVTSAGGNQPHPNMPPYLGVNFLIALVGIFPSRN